MATDGHPPATEARTPAPRTALAGALLVLGLVLLVLAAPAPAARLRAPDGLRPVAAPPDVARARAAARPRAGVRPAAGLRAVADPRDADAWHLASDAPLGVWDAWSRTTGGDVTVAILDTGADLGHPDLAPNLWTNPGEVPGNGIDDDHDGTVDDLHGVDLVNHDGDPADDNGHGTHVAGIAGAVGANGIGASGIAWRVRLMVVKVLDQAAAGDTGTVAAGIRWAVAHGARVINLSLSGAGRSDDLEDAIAAAGAAGVLVVAAAGNDGRDLGLLPSYPASYPDANLLAVAATRPDGLLSAVSSFGAGVDLAAPGDTVFATARGGSYEYRTGTSMAAPMVTGTAALLLSVDPSLDAAGLVRALVGTARRSVLPVGAGTLDAGAAIASLPGAPPAQAPAPATAAAATPAAVPAADAPSAAAVAADRARLARDARAARRAADRALAAARRRAARTARRRAAARAAARTARATAIRRA